MSRAGFTLVEVMISTVIAMLLIATLYSCWAAVVNVTHTGTAAAQAAHRERMAMEAIEEALAGAAWFKNQNGLPFILSEGPHGSRLTVQTRVPRDFWGHRELSGHGFRQIDFFTEPAGDGTLRLVMTQQPLLVSNAVNRTVRTVLLPRAEEFAVKVQAGKPDPRDEWLTSWPVTNRYSNLLPQLADISLGSLAAAPFHRVVPVYASASDHAGAPPAIGTATNIAGVAFGEGGFDVSDNDSAARLIFLIDKSGSMHGARLATAKQALMNTLNHMDSSGKFYVFFFSKQSDPMPSSAMLEASPDNIARMKEWIDSRKPGGGTDPTASLKAAFMQKPTELFLLTDGQFNTARGEPTIHQLINSLNQGKEAKVNTLALGNDLSGKDGEAVLMLIAKDNGGTFTHINPNAEPPPASPPAPKP